MLSLPFVDSPTTATLAQLLLLRKKKVWYFLPDCLQSRVCFALWPDDGSEMTCMVKLVFQQHTSKLHHMWSSAVSRAKVSESCLGGGCRGLSFSHAMSSCTAWGTRGCTHAIPEPPGTAAPGNPSRCFIWKPGHCSGPSYHRC